MRIIIIHALCNTSGSRCWVQIKITWGFFPNCSCRGFIHIKSKSLGEIQALVCFQSLLEVFKRKTKWRTMVLDKGRKKSSILAWICLDSIVHAGVAYKKRNTMTGIKQQHFGIVYSMCMIFRRQNIFLSFQIIWIPEQKDLNWSFSALPATCRHTHSKYVHRDQTRCFRVTVGLARNNAK